MPRLGLNGDPAFKHSEAFSFQVATADQSETDRYWDAIVGSGGQEQIGADRLFADVLGRSCGASEASRLRSSIG